MFLHVLPSARDKSGHHVNIKYILNEQRERRPLLFFALPPLKKQMVSFSGLCSLMNFSSYRHLCLCQMSFSRMHISLAEVHFLFHAAKAKSAGRLPPSTPNLLQTSCNFYLPSSSQPKQHRACVKIQPSGI